MKTKITTIAAAAAFIAAASFAPAAHAFMDGEAASLVRQHFQKVAAELNLSAEQRREVRTILRNDRDQYLPLLQQLKAEHRKLRSLIQADSLDETAIRAQSARVASVQASLAVARAHVSQELRSLLTPDQVQKFREIQAKRDQRRDRIGARIMNWIDEDN